MQHDQEQKDWHEQWIKDPELRKKAGVIAPTTLLPRTTIRKHLLSGV